MGEPSATAELALFAVGVDARAVPSVVLARGKSVVGDSLLRMRRPAGRAAIRPVIEALADLDQSGSVSAAGQANRWSPSSAALLIATAMQVSAPFDLGPPAVAAALAVAQLVDSDGPLFLSGVIAGLELGYRVRKALGERHIEFGDASGTAGHLAAATAAARVLSLPVTNFTHALGMAATQAAGTKGQTRTGLNGGKAASDGVDAALLARSGFTASDAGIEGRRGLLEVMGGQAAAPSELVLGLGTAWRFAEAKSVEASSRAETALRDRTGRGERSVDPQFIVGQEENAVIATMVEDLESSPACSGLFSLLT